MDDPCFTIHDIELTGEGASGFRWLLRDAEPYVGQCLGASALRQMVGRLNQRLLTNGYTTSKVALGSQNLRAGALSLQLDLGYVSAIGMVRDTPQGKQADHGWGTFKNAVPLSSGDVLNVHALEHGLEHMKRLSSQTLSTLIKPGDAPGTSDIELLRNTATWRERTHGGLSIDNSGSTALGRGLLSGYFIFDNPLGLNDLLNASASTNVEQPKLQHRSQSVNLGYSVPWGYNLLNLSYSRARFAQNVVGTTTTFVSHGGSETAEVRLSRTLWRTGSGKWGAFFGVSGRTADSYIDDVELIVQRRRVVNGTTGVNFKQLFGDAKLDGEFSYRQGKDWFRAEDDLTLRDPKSPSLRPRLFNANFTLATPLKLGTGAAFDYSATLRYQHTSDRSLSTDQFGIGSRYTVRGFDGAAVFLGESGFTFRQDLSRSIAGLWPGVETVGYMGLDFGRVWGPSTDSTRGNKLLGLALGLRAKRGAIAADLSVGTPLYHPTSFHSARANLYATLSYQF